MMLALLTMIALTGMLVATFSVGDLRGRGLSRAGRLCLLLLALPAAAFLVPSSAGGFAGRAASADEKESAEQPEAKKGAEAARQEEAARRDKPADGSDEPDVNAPLERITNVERLDADRYPGWLREDPNLPDSQYRLASTDQGGNVAFEVVESMLSLTNRQSRRDLHKQWKEATDDYINDYLDSERAAKWVGYDGERIRSELVRDTFEERIYFPHLGGEGREMHRAHALLAFDDAFHRQLDERWEEVVATSRLMQAGLGAGAVLLLLGVMFSYFVLDTATRGYYTGRLQFATAAAILAVLAAGVLVGRWIPWM